MKDYSIDKGNSFVKVSFNDTDFHEVQDEETGEYTEVYEEYFKLDHVFVAKESRGEGLAKSMISEVVSSIKADFPEALIVLAAMPEDDKPIDQEKLVSLYRKCGFDVARGQEGSTAVIMEYTK